MKTFILGMMVIALLVLSTGAFAESYYEKYNKPAEKDINYEEKYIEVPSYSGEKVYKVSRTLKWTPTSTQSYGTYGPELESVEPTLTRPLPKVEKKIPAKIETKTITEGVTFTGQRLGTITQINYNGRYDYGFVKKDNSAFKIGFTAEHGKFKRYDKVKYDLKNLSKNRAIAVNLVLVK